MLERLGKSCLSRRGLIAAGGAFAGLGVGPGNALAAEELNALVWCDHTDPALIQPFEEKHGVKVNLKE